MIFSCFSKDFAAAVAERSGRETTFEDVLIERVVQRVVTDDAEGAALFLGGFLVLDWMVSDVEGGPASLS